MKSRQNFWISITLLNLIIVAFLGMVLRSKFVFTIPFVNYRHFLSAHSHFAFGGWVTLALFVLLIYKVLPPEFSEKKIYQWTLGAIQITSLGMAFSFPFQGYGAVALVSSTSFIFASYFFIYIFIRDVLKTTINKTVKFVAISAVLCFLISSAGPFILAYIMATKSSSSILYRDAVYGYLHFQYNGFFVLAIFSVILNKVLTIAPPEFINKMKRFVYVLVASIVPTLFLTMEFTHPNITAIKIMAITGAAINVYALICFIICYPMLRKNMELTDQWARRLFIFSMLGFILKMILQIGTVFPKLGIIIFSNRPAIIGFMHLVFLIFVSLFIISAYTENKNLDSRRRFTAFAIGSFVVAVFYNEILLFLQGAGMLFGYTSPHFPILLWTASVLLLVSAILLAVSNKQKGTTEVIPSNNHIA